MDFWWGLPWVSNPGLIPWRACFVARVQWIPQNHFECNTYWRLGGQFGDPSRFPSTYLHTKFAKPFTVLFGLFILAILIGFSSLQRYLGRGEGVIFTIPVHTTPTQSQVWIDRKALFAERLRLPCTTFVFRASWGELRHRKCIELICLRLQNGRCRRPVWIYIAFTLTENESDTETSMHSSGMRTARLLTVSRHALGEGGRGGLYPSMHRARGMCIPASTGQGGMYPSMNWAGGRVSAQGGDVCPRGVCPGGGRHPPVNRMTERQV